MTKKSAQRVYLCTRLHSRYRNHRRRKL